MAWRGGKRGGQRTLRKAGGRKGSAWAREGRRLRIESLESKLLLTTWIFDPIPDQRVPLDTRYVSMLVGPYLRDADAAEEQAQDASEGFTFSAESSNPRLTGDPIMGGSPLPDHFLLLMNRHQTGTAEVTITARRPGVELHCTFQVEVYVPEESGDDSLGWDEQDGLDALDFVESPGALVVEDGTLTVLAADAIAPGAGACPFT